ncbi:MAG TPA: glycosyltransferase family 4 protein [Longimicrobium sp.]|nr:glycosyltransferase family 4 protein [Longimicrobium sp.]
MRPRLLFLCQNLPFPPDGGVQIRSWNVLRLLAREFDVTALCFYRAGTRSTPAAVEESLRGMREVAETEAFAIPQEHSRARLAADHLRSVLSGRAYTVAAYDSAELRRTLRGLLAGRRFDLAHVDSLDLSGYLPLLSGLPTVCTHHNVESALLRRRAASEATAARRAYLRLQARLTEAEERRWCPRVALNVAVSEDDRALLARLAPGARFMVVPNGVDTTAFQPGAGGREGIVFVGGYGWHPNRDALEHFCADVLPLVRARRPGVPVTFVGRAPEAVRREYRERHGVELTGYVDDVRPLVRGAACYVAPLRVGGGTRLKILDAWALGKAVVSTSVGCEGLETRDGENILVRDGAQAFADAVCRVLEDEGLRARLERGARRTAVERYDWEVIAGSMLDAYASLLGGGPAGVETLRAAG